MSSFSMGCRRAPNLLLSTFLIFTAIFHVAFSVDDYSDDGSISINCGSEKEYYDDITGRRYITDHEFVDTGSNRDTSGGGTSQNVPGQLKDLRFFREGKRNCYVLHLGQGGKYRYLIRALFRYGNYDGNDQKPEFDLYIGINKWKTVKASDPEPDYYVYHEIIYDFPMNSESVDVCLVNTDRGTPFISALELRPMDSSVYPVEPGIGLSMTYRYDIGYHPGIRWDVTTNSSVTFKPENPIGDVLPSRRYKDDPYDRIWSQYSGSDNDATLEWYTVDEDIGNDAYGLPQDVWKTLGQPGGHCLNFIFKTTSQHTTEYYAYFHLADFYKDVQRDMRINLYGEYLDKGPILAPYMKGLTNAYSRINKVNEDIKLSICTDDGPYHPILNAIELYEQVLISNISTNPEDAKTMKSIKQAYRVQIALCN